jgi:hypothetical protein
MIVKHPFAEPDGSFSWRKTGTAIVFIIFAIACYGYLAFGWKELPESYTGIIKLVFVFYFLKDGLRQGAQAVMKKLFGDAAK